MLKIYAFLDPCHMIKLVRGAISELRTLKDEKDGLVRWQYLVELEKLQASEGLRLANKLKKAHINWKPQKMKMLDYTDEEKAMDTGQGTEEKDNENASVYLAKNGYTV
ncbi:uncharacterized protein LOC124456320 [Xenia sp. Carnegie-2017]|uniref:uncharacterized protein LOC124456320 n=1 Tax=Xenia sp. Carnegie-2017 TaxID=2897299 RepID=UPI001F048BC6|nr:uncharacterized protein LOC124456320 [Xenia sp. Carnegie-2017]